MHNMHEQTTKELVYAFRTGNTWIGVRPFIDVSLWKDTVIVLQLHWIKPLMKGKALVLLYPGCYIHQVTPFDQFKYNFLTCLICCYRESWSIGLTWEKTWEIIMHRVFMARKPVLKKYVTRLVFIILTRHNARSHSLRYNIKGLSKICMTLFEQVVLDAKCVLTFEICSLVAELKLKA